MSTTVITTAIAITLGSPRRRSHTTGGLSAKPIRKAKASGIRMS